MKKTTVQALMTEHPMLIRPETTLKEAAAKMETIDCGVLPVGTEDKLQGMITDRDIVIRAVAKGKDPAKEKVQDYMTTEVISCKQDDSLETAADLMRKHQVSRLIVKGGDGKVSGILSFGGILRKDYDEEEVSNVVQHAFGKQAA